MLTCNWILFGKFFSYTFVAHKKVDILSSLFYILQEKTGAQRAFSGPQLCGEFSNVRPPEEF
jgi:hypothetical protein